MRVYVPLKRVANIALTLALLVFAFIYIRDIVRQADFDVPINLPLLTLSIICFVGYYILMAINWLISTKVVAKNTGITQGLVFIASQPYKYMPTSLFILSSRAMFAKKLGLSIKQSSIAQLLENGSILAANFTLFSVLYVYMLLPIYGVLLALACSIVIFVVYVRKSLSFTFRGRSITVESNKLAIMFLATLIGWLLCGLSFILLNSALGFEISILTFLAANTLAFSLSMLAFFAPGGIGVRELVYSRFGVSAAAIIYWRIFVFVLDIVLGILAILAIRQLSASPKDQSVESGN